MAGQPLGGNGFGDGRPLVSVPGPEFLDLWPQGSAPVDLTVWAMADGDPVPGGPSGAPSLVVPPYMGAGRVAHRLAEVPGLRAVQLLTAGYEDVLAAVPAGVALANAAGVHDTSTAELAVALAISALRGIGDFARAQVEGQWFFGFRPALADRRVLLIGTGSVGTAIARRLSVFEVELTRVGRTARVDEHGPVYAVGELETLLPHHDVVILVVPLTEATRHLVDAAFLAAMPDGALLVNVARGGVVDTDALLAELNTGRLLAALDVTDPEPLPPDHPLWRAPGVLITPHVGGNTSAFLPRAKRLLVDQLTRYATGAPLQNVVTP